MKNIIFVLLGLFFLANASYGEEWEGKKMLIDERDKVIAACEEGISRQGYAYSKVNKYCKCSVDHMTELATKYSKEQLKIMQRQKGKRFIEEETLKMCKHHLN